MNSKGIKIKNVTSSGSARYEEGYLVNYTSSNKESIPSIALLEVRAAVVFPSGTMPGFTLVMGQKLERNPHGLNPLLFLTEHQPESFEAQIHKLTEEVPRLKVQSVYCDHQNEGMLHFLRKRFHSIRTPRLSYSDDITYGHVMIAESLSEKTLEGIPKDSILHSDLMKISSNISIDLLPSSFHALRFLIGGFQAHAPNTGSCKVIIEDCVAWT